MKNLHTIIRDDEEIRLPLMKSLVAMLMVLCMSFGAKAQVNIPDAGFRFYINDQFPGAMVGNNLDTSSAITLGVHRISIENYPGPTVANLDGIQYFKNLDTLQLDFNHAPLSFPSILPSHLSFLFIQNVDISDSLNHLPGITKGCSP